MIIYTFGYNSNSLQYFEAKVKELDAIVVDVRFNPNSFSPFWTRKNLEKCFSSYKHVPSLGNKKYKEKGVMEIVDLNSGCEEVISMMELGFNCILLCACLNLEECHRKIIAEEISKKTKCEIIHL